MRYIRIPGTGTKLVDGSVVILTRYPELRWIVHEGWYRYEGSRHEGWYFQSIPKGDTIPVSISDLKSLEVVSGGYDDDDFRPRPHPHPPCPPHPPHPPKPEPLPDDPDKVPAKFTVGLKKQVDAAFITVETLEDRGKLLAETQVNGKLVRVNNVDGQVKYYTYSAHTDEWHAVDIEPDLSEYATSEYVDNAVSDVELLWGSF